VDRQLKKVAKSDRFKQEFWHSFEFLTEHPAEVKKYGAILLVLLVLAGGIYYYNKHQAEVRQTALAEALRVDDATVGANTSAVNLHFNTEEEKRAGVVKAFTELTVKYHGSQEGAIAGMYLAQAAADKNDMAQAEKLYKDVADSGPKAYSSMAKMALAQLYEIQGKDAESEKILADLMVHPTITVSKEQAIIGLARLKAKKDPDAARKMLEPLRMERPAVSKAAVQALADIAGLKLK
jgi:predicted negative regulator of RcsB-dependent stress response